MWMRAANLEAVEGQDHRRIPRRIEEPDFSAADTGHRAHRNAIMRERVENGRDHAGQVNDRGPAVVATS